MLKNVLAQLWRRLPARVRLWTVRLTNPKFTVTAAAVIFNEHGHVLLLKHRFRPGSGWGLPGGFLKADEQPVAALKRELQEEIGLEIEQIELFSARTFKRPRQVEILFLGNGRGQPNPRSVEVERSLWFAPGDLPPSLPAGQKSVIERAVEKQRV